MLHQKSLSRVVLVAVVLTIFILSARTVIPTRADGEDDGRINEIPWVNGHGAVAVYCVDEDGEPGTSFEGGGINVLGSNGQKLLFASEDAIIEARAKLGAQARIAQKGVYTLWAL